MSIAQQKNDEQEQQQDSQQKNDQHNIQQQDGHQNNIQQKNNQHNIQKNDQHHTNDDDNYDDDDDDDNPLGHMWGKRKQKVPIFASGDSSDILHPEQLTVVTSHLPYECSKLPWKLLFSTYKHGASFTTFYSNTMYKGPIVLLIKDLGGHVFGGFCAPSLASGTEFFGDNSCFLFSVLPTPALYVASNLNQNFVYLNVEKKRTRPTCFGMGGQLERFALQVDDSMARGASREACATFVSPMLAHEQDFEILVLEAWGFVGMASKCEQPPKPKHHVSEEERRTGRFLLKTAGIIGDYTSG